MSEAFRSVSMDRITRGPQRKGQLILFIIYGELILPSKLEGTFSVTDCDTYEKLPIGKMDTPEQPCIHHNMYPRLTGKSYSPVWKDGFYEFKLMFAVVAGRHYRLRIGFLAEDGSEFTSDVLTWNAEL